MLFLNYYNIYKFNIIKVFINNFYKIDFSSIIIYRDINNIYYYD